MTPQRAAALLPIIKAFSEGQETQYRLSNDAPWLPCVDPTWFTTVDYRIKPKTIKYRRYLAVNPVMGHCVGTVNQLDLVAVVQLDARFIRWIDTEWQEVEII